MTIFQWAMVAVVLAQPLDWYSTYKVLTQGGHELNTWLLKLQAFLYGEGFEGRWVWLTVSKLLAVAVCLGLGLLAPQGMPLWANIVICCVALGYWGVVVHNFTQIKRPI